MIAVAVIGSGRQTGRDPDAPAIALRVTFKDKTQVPAHLVAAAALQDIALLKVVVPGKLPTLQCCFSRAYREIIGCRRCIAPIGARAVLYEPLPGLVGTALRKIARPNHTSPLAP